MNHSEPDPAHLKQIRRLTLVLITSVSLNIALVGAFLYGFGGGFLLSNDSSAGRLGNVRHIPLAKDRSNEEILRSLVHMLPEQLVAKLSDTQQLEDGYTYRDLVLGCLVSVHHFDIHRALRGTRVPKERLLLVEEKQVPIYLGLTEAQYQQLAAFLNDERWPLTTQGLFLALKQPNLYSDPSLAEAFCLTQEFLTLQRLFSRAEASVERNQVLELFLQCDWPTFHGFYMAALDAQEASPVLRRRLLSAFILGGSRVATQLMLKCDGSFAAQYLDDATILAMLAHMEASGGPDVESFVSALIRTQRGDEVLQRAHQLCCQALAVAVSEVEEQRPLKSEHEKIYVVQRGDSLWKISKQHRVPIQTLKDYNGLQGDLLKPGATLKIP